MYQVQSELIPEKHTSDISRHDAELTFERVSPETRRDLPTSRGQTPQPNDEAATFGLRQLDGATVIPVLSGLCFQNHVRLVCECVRSLSSTIEADLNTSTHVRTRVSSCGQT